MLAAIDSGRASGLENSVERVRAASVAAGRPQDAVAMQVFLNHVALTAESERDAEASRFRQQYGMPPGSLDECPYVLIGEPERMLDTVRGLKEHLDLQSILVSAALPPETAERLMDRVTTRV